MPRILLDSLGHRRPAPHGTEHGTLEHERVQFWHPPMLPITGDSTLFAENAAATTRDYLVWASHSMELSPERRAKRLADVAGVCRRIQGPLCERMAFNQRLSMGAICIGGDELSMFEACSPRTWCAQQTGCYCDGGQDGCIVISCRQPACTLCDKVFLGCPHCFMQLGRPAKTCEVPLACTVEFPSCPAVDRPVDNPNMFGTYKIPVSARLSQC